MPETSDARLVAGRQVLLELRLQEDLKGEVDLHLAMRLVERGCPVELALQILL